MPSSLSPACRAQDADRHRHLRQRRHTDQVLALAAHLKPGDRLLIEQVYGQGLSVCQVARMSGVQPRMLQRRVARLLRHLRDPRFRFVAGRHDLLPRDLQATARRVFLERRSLRETARLTGLSLHRVRENVKAVQALQRVL